MYFQLAFPKRITLEATEEGYKEAKGLVKKHNGSTPVFRTIYNFRGNPSTYSAVIDKLYFDFDYDSDNPTRARDDIIKFHKFLVEKNIKHVTLFSGNGYHLFLFTEEVYSSSLQNPTGTIRNAINFFANKLDIKTDARTRDLMRVARVPGTINTKTGKHCIYLNEETLYKSRDELLEIARSPKINEKCIFGSEIIDLKEYDYESEVYEYVEIDSEIDIDSDSVLALLPKCLAVSLGYGDCGYHERYAIITAMRDSLISYETAKETLRRYLTAKKYHHCVHVENQLKYLYGRSDLLCPSCYTLKDQGLCVKGCSGHNIYI